MKKLQLQPNGFPCTLNECPPGLFLFNNNVCMKSEYGDNESYCDTGEFFAGGVADKALRGKLIVQPLTAKWVEE